jgi:hypothetical protein
MGKPLMPPGGVAKAVDTFDEFQAYFSAAMVRNRVLFLVFYMDECVSSQAFMPRFEDLIAPYGAEIMALKAKITGRASQLVRALCGCGNLIAKGLTYVPGRQELRNYLRGVDCTPRCFVLEKCKKVGEALGGQAAFDGRLKAAVTNAVR